MIPATYPSILDSSNRTKMLVYQVPSITGLTRWIDYIPVKSPTSESDLTLANTFANEGFILTSKVNDITGLVPFKDYVPIYLDSTATKAWSADNDGYIPMAELAGLLLDFTTGSLDSRINFTRTTNATVTNSAGQITYAPHNLQTFSEQFDNAAWFKTRSSISANNIAAPNGTTTADKLIEDTTASNSHIMTIAVVTAAANHCFSVYAKKGERTWIRLANASVANATAFFNLDTGVVGALGAGAVFSAIENIGNGWYRCSIVATATAASNTFSIALSTDGTIVNYTGDGTSGAYIWGAQLEVGASPTTYNSTTVKNLLGYSELFDNAAWTKSNSFVQTNLLTFSEDFTVAGWAKTTITATANSLAAPNTYQTADTLIATGANSTALQTFTASAVPYTFSVYLYRKTGTGNIDITVDGTTWVTKTIIAGWTRVDTTLTPAAGSKTAGIRIVTSGDEVYAWGAQLVQGSVAGDYRRTDSTSLPVYYANHNGVVCAEKLVETTAASTTHGITQAVTTSGSANTISVYAKAGERNWVLVGDSTVASARAWFNLSTGVKGTLGVGASSSTMESVGNGYYRCSVTLTTTAASNTFYIYSATADGAATYTGDGTSGIYIFGAQLSDSASLDPYVLNAAAAPIAAAYYGARFDYDPVTLLAKGLLIEEQRANLLLNSTIAGTNLATQNVTVTAVAHTLSFYGTGNIVLSGTASATLTGTGAYPTRSTLTFTPTAGTLTLTVTGTVQYAQLEIGAFATSYIPTAASQVTRAADVATIQGSNFYSWYNQNEGSYATQYDTVDLVNNIVHANTDGGNTNQVTISTSNSNPIFQVLYNSVTEVSIDSGTVISGQLTKESIAYKVNSFASVINNGTVGTDSLGSTPQTTLLQIGRGNSGGAELNGHIKSISYYPQRLSNEVLKGLTA